MTEDTKLILEEIKEIKTDLQGVKTELKEVKTDLQGVKTELKEVKTDLQGVKTDLQGVKTDLQEVKIDLQNTKTELQGQLTEIKLTLDNEIRPNIRLVAEGHAILNRKLDEALKVESEKELLLVRVSMLETDVREIKKTLNMTA